MRFVCWQPPGDVQEGPSFPDSQNPDVWVFPNISALQRMVPPSGTTKVMAFVKNQDCGPVR